MAMAGIGYNVYSINYTLAVRSDPTRQFPVQWTDGKCLFGIRLLGKDGKQGGGIEDHLGRPCSSYSSSA